MPTLEQLEAMLARGPDTALLRFSLGSEYLKTGEYERAIEHLARAVELDPSYSAAWKLLGKALAASHRPEEAARAYEKGIAAAEAKGDIQAAKEMRVFLKRLGK
jgi:predicted Zn-dependent protease